MRICQQKKKPKNGYNYIENKGVLLKFSICRSWKTLWIVLASFWMWQC